MPYELPAACAELVQLQNGVLSRRQALAGGMPPDVIDRLVRDGRWQTLQRGVYSVFTGQLTRAAELWAAVERAGSNSALSHQTAAELFKLVDEPGPLIHITIPEQRRVSPIPGVVVHRSNRMAETVHPTLRPVRIRIEETVLDLAGQATTFESAFGVVCNACQRRLTTPDHLATAMTKRRKQRWRQELVRGLGEVGAGVHSLLEYRYVHRVERPHGLPTATRQARVDGDDRSRYLDNLYEDFRLCVELDGLQAHPDHQRWQDQRRINAITEHGITTLRYGWSDLDRLPCQVAAQVAAVLRNLGWSGQGRPCGPACAARRRSSP